MKKLFYVDIGYSEPTEVYELVPKKIASLKGASLDEIGRYLQGKDARHLIVDSGSQREIDLLQLDGFNVIKGRMPDLEARWQTLTISQIKRRMK